MKFKAGADSAGVLKGAGATDVKTFSQIRTHVITVPSSAAPAVIAALSKNPSVEHAGAPAKFHKAGTPNDPSYSQQWALPKTEWDQAYGVVSVSGSANLAILDTGVDASHPDLAGRMGSGISETGGDPNSDPNGHGTAMAGIAAADVNNGAGIAGVDYAGAKIISVQVLDATGAGDDTTVVPGVLAAADAGAQVILMAFSSADYSSSLADAVSYAQGKGAAVIASTGNDGSGSPTYPAGLPGVVGVAATDSNDNLAANSNTGSAAVAAPGVNILALAPGGGTTSVSGTSPAAAMVAGEAALLIGAGKSGSSLTGATDPISGRSFGRINIAKALGVTAPVATATPATSPTPGATPTYVADSTMNLVCNGVAVSSTAPCVTSAGNNVSMTGSGSGFGSNGDYIGFFLCANSNISCKGSGQGGLVTGTFTMTARGSGAASGTDYTTYNTTCLRSDMLGGAGCTVTAPNPPASGLYTITAWNVDSQNNHTDIISGFRIPATMSIAPTSGVVGTTVTVTGAGFDTSPVTVYFDTITGNTSPGTGNSTLLASCTTSGGNITGTSCQVTIPASTAGAHQIWVNDNGNPQMTFTVIPQITTVSASSGQVGTTPQISGNGYAGSSNVSLSFVSGASASQGGTCTTNSSGSFSGSSACALTVSQGSTGAHSVKGVDAAGNTSDPNHDGTFTISAPSISSPVAAALPGATATVTGGAGFSFTGSIHLYADGNHSTGTLLTGGCTASGTGTFSSCSFTVPAGWALNSAHTITAYDGTNDSNAASFTVSNQVTTTTTVTSSKNPSTYGDSVTLTATVSPSSATGTVTFKDGNTVLCANATLTNGVATCTTSTLNAGSHSITASYNPDNSVDVTSTGSLTQTVNKANPTVVVTGYTVGYDGAAHIATGTATGVKGEALSGLNLSGTTHTTAGAYTDSWTFTDVTGNYNNTSGSVSDTISGIALTATVTINSKTYDGTTAATISGCTLNGVLPADAANVSCKTSGATATFASPNVGTPVSANVTGLALSGTAAGNYTLPSTATSSANITAKALTAAVTVNNKTYDGGTAATINSCALSGVLAADQNNVSCNTGGATATFASANVGTGIPVSISGLALSGNAAGNYSLPSTATSSANITGLALTSTVTTKNKVYDGGTGATINSCALNGVLAADSNNVSCNTGGATATFASSNVGTGISVSVSGLALSGSAAGNYTLPATASSSANITALALTATVTANNKTYDATTTATIGSCALNGVLGGDAGKVSCDTTNASAAFTSANAGNGIAVNVSGLALSGAAAGNYSLPGTASSSANIAKADPSIVVTPYSVTYNSSAHTATGTAKGVLNENLSGLDLSATTHTNAGTTTDAWTFTDVTGNYNNKTGTTTDTINKANAVISVTGYSVTYDGGAHLASGTAAGVGSDGNLGSLLDLSGTSHTDANTYNDTWTFNSGNTTNGNYNSANGSVTDSIGQATATINVTGYSVTYDGNAHTAIGTATGVGDVNLASLLVLGGTTHTSAGTTTDAWSFTGNQDYAPASGHVTDVIGKANATIVVTPYHVTYDGGSHTAGGSAKGAQGETLTGLDLSGTTHSAAGDFASDSWSFTDVTGNYNNASSTVDDKIDKANATVNVTPYSVTYDGNAHTATGTATGVNGEALSGLDLSGTTHTTAGTTTDTWNFTDATGNYNNATGTVSDSIAKANATITVTPYTKTYDGDPHTATVTAAGVKSEDLSGLVDLTGTTHTSAGDYASDPWSFAGNVDYNATSGTVHDSIAKASASITVNAYSVTYDGAAHLATGTASGVKGENLSGLDLTATSHTAAGSFSDAWTFTDVTGNYSNASGTAADSIAKANAVVSVTGYTTTYDGSAHTATGTAKGVRTETLAGLDLSATRHTLAATYAGDAWTFTDVTGNYNNASGTVDDKIGKADAAITVTPYTVTYDGNSHTATGTALGAQNEALAGLDLSGTTHTAAGDYSGDTWTFTDATGNYNNASGTSKDSIAKAKATVSVSPYNVTYDAAAHTATGTATGVKGEALSGLVLTGTTHTNAGATTDTWTFTDVTGNYDSATDTVSDNIAKAKASIAVTPYKVTFDNAAHTATGTATGVKAEPLAGLDLSGTTHTVAGMYAVDAWAFADVTGNYSNDSGTVADAILAPNLSFSKTIDAASECINGTCQLTNGQSTVGFTLTAQNGGTSADTGVALGTTVTDTLPQSPYNGFSWAIAGGSDNGCSLGGVTLTCSFGDIAPGSSKKVDVQAVLPVGANDPPVANGFTGNAGDYHYDTVNGVYTRWLIEFPSANKTTSYVNTASASAINIASPVPASATLTIGGNHNATCTVTPGSSGDSTLTVTPATCGTALVNDTTPPDFLTGESWTVQGLPQAEFPNALTELDFSVDTTITPGTSVLYLDGSTWKVVPNQTNNGGTITFAITSGSTPSLAAHLNGNTVQYALGMVNTTTKVVSSKNASTYGDSVSFTATVSPASGILGTPAGTVQFKIDGSNFGSAVTLNNGTASSGSIASLTAGGHAIVALYNDDPNHGLSSGSLTQNVNKASAVINVTPYAVTYDGSAHMAGGTATGVNAEDLTSLLTLSGTTHTNAADYPSDAWTFAGNANYSSASGTTHDSIAKANAKTLTVTPYHVTYDGAAHTASGAATGVTGEDLSSLFGLSGTTHTNAGDFNADAWTFNAGNANGNYNSATGTVEDIVDKAKANISVTGYSVTFDTQAHTATGSATGVNAEDLSGLLNLGGTTHTDAGTYGSDAWTFAGNGNYQSASGTVADAIGKASVTLSLSGYTVTYDGNGHTATGTATGLNNLDLSNLLDFTATTHTDAGTSTDTVTFAGNTDYSATSGTVTDTINKAGATITVTPYTVAFDGNAHTASGNAKGVKGEDLTNLLTVTGTTHTNAGDYPSDAWTFAGNGDYSATSGTVHDSISKVDAKNITVTPYHVTFDGGSHTATGSATGVNGENLSSLLDLSGTTHSNSGTYTDAWSFAGNGNYNAATGTVTDQVDKANATISVTPYHVTYDGNSHTATDGATGVNAENLSSLLDLSGTTHTNAGTYSDTWNFAGNSNYNSATGTVTDQIDKANAKTLTVTPYHVTYDGGSHTAAGTATGVQNEDLSSLLTLSGTTHTGAGDYASDAWSFAGNGNYNAATGTVTDQIDKANATISVTPYHVTYDGNGHTATDGATGVNAENLSSLLDLSGTTHTNAGTYSDTWNFAGNSNYNSATGTVTDQIDKAAASVGVTPYTVTYDGNSHTASGSATGVKGETLTGLSLTGTTHTNAGVYNDTWTFTDVTGNYSNSSGQVTDTINKADAKNLTVTAYHVTYDANSHTATGSATGVQNEDLSSLLNLSGTTHTAAGSYSDSWTFNAGNANANYNSASGTVTDVIDKAHLATVADSKSKVYGQPNPALTAHLSGFVGGQTESALRLSGAVSGSPTLSTGATQNSTFGSYAITVVDAGSLAATNYDFPANQFQNSTLTVTRAATSVTVTSSPAVYTLVQNVNLTATVANTTANSTAAVNEGSVTFTIGGLGWGAPGSSTCTGNVSNGSAGATCTIPAGTQAGSYTINASYNDAASNPQNFQNSTNGGQTPPAKVTVNKRPTSLTGPVRGDNPGIPTSANYGDQITLTSTLSDTTGTPIVPANEPVSFALGTNRATGTTDATGKAVTSPFNVTTNVGTYTSQASFAGDNAYANSSAPNTFTVIPACVKPLNGYSTTYTGSDIYWTPTQTSNVATVLLSASIVPCLNNVQQYPDITKATVTFGQRNADGSFSAINGATNLPVGLANPGDPSVGVASATINMSLSSSQTANSFELAIIVGGNYKRNSFSDDVAITIARPQPGGEIVGDGSIQTSKVTSGGTLAATSGNIGFGYSVSFNSSLRNPQGQAIITWTAADGHTYQAKSNAISTLQVVSPGGQISNGSANNTCNATVDCAMFTAKSSIVDLSTGAGIDGGANFQLTMSDNGKSGDTLGVTIYNAKSGGLWFSSNYVASAGKTIEAVATNANGGPADTITVKP